jgi:hypothetical protein
MTTDEMASLVEDIRANGLAQPIVTHEGEILDGRHRYHACLQAGVEPQFTEFRGRDALAFVLSANLNRRHLSVAQRAMVAAKIANMPAHRPEEKCANLRTSQPEAAETLGVSRRSVQTAAQILDESPKLAKEVEAGKITLNAARKQLPPAPTKRTIPPPPSQVVDATGWPIPTQLIPLWQRTDEVQEMLTILSRVKGTLRAAQENRDKLFAEVNFSSALSQLDQAWYDIKTAKPFAVCPTCQGEFPDKCTFCRGRGLISEHRWNTCVTREDKEFREKAKSGKAETGKGNHGSRTGQVVVPPAREDPRVDSAAGQGLRPPGDTAPVAAAPGVAEAGPN